MPWNENTMAALRSWLSPETSHKWHPIDDGRFYEFIHAVWQEKQTLWDESEARETIERVYRELHPNDGDELVTRVAQKRREEGSLILDYLSHLMEVGRI